MRIFITILIVLLLLTSLEARKRKEKLAEQKQTQSQRTSVVEANHFYSKDEKSTSIHINTLETDKSLVFFLKPQSNKADDKTMQTNPITITLDAKPDKVTCTFNSYTNLCSLPKITDKEMDLRIECKDVPCELSWQIVQPPVKEQDGDQTFNQLVAVNADKNHAVLSVRCDNPQIKATFGDNLKLYSNSLNKQINSKQGLTVFLFSNEEKGYYYLTSQDQKTLACANASLKSVQDVIPFNNPNFSQFDFVSWHDPSTYEFKTVPETDFRIDLMANDITFQKLTNQTGINLKLSGWNGETQKVLSTMYLAVDDQKSFIEFSVVYKKPTEKFERMEIAMQGTGNPLIVQSAYYANDVQDVEFQEESYFDLKKGEKINYKMIPLSGDIKNINKINIFVQGDQFKASKTDCGPEGCEFTVEATADGIGRIYLGESQDKQAKEINVQEIGKSVTRKIREGEEVYYSYKMKDTTALQLLVNTPNVIVYAANEKKCPTVDEDSCYENVFNSLNPSIYEPTEAGTLLFKVIGLDTAEFTLRILNEDSFYVMLKDTVPFTYLMDDKENQLIFGFRNKDKVDVSFNLIAPVNQLNLVVLNKQKIDKSDKGNEVMSADGYIQFKKKQIKEEFFTILVRKNEKYMNKYVHFTLIASTKETNLRLESGVAHYETLPPKGSSNYVFQYQVKKRTMLNIYTHNMKDDLKLIVKVSNANKYDDDNNTAEFTVDQEVDVVNLGMAAKRLCELSKGMNCELFMRIVNTMDVELDVTMTLMIQDAIIQLKDGIWQSYSVSWASITSHFYFFPTHQNHSTTIFYKSSAVDLKIMYSLWQNDDTSISPSQWPFPLQFKENQKLSELSFKPLQFFHIEPDQLKTCWPNCIVLMSIAPDVSKLSKEDKKKGIKPYIDESFKIMASNNYIELPQKQLVDVPLVKDEDKQILVDLKYVMDKEALTFNTYNTLGKAVLKANVYSERHPRCPSTDGDGDFDFHTLTTTLTTEDIKSKFEEKDMADDNNLYLCILAHAPTDTKFSIEFSSDQNGFKKLEVDTRITLDTKQKSQTYYYMDISSQFYLKVTRNEGFPFLATTICKNPDDTSKCMEKFTDNAGEGTQLAEKVISLDEIACEGCLLLIKFYSEDPFNIDIHPQSKYSQIQLTQNRAMSDSLAVDQKNSYQLTGSQNEQIVINIQIISGNLKVQVHDFDKIDITKTNKEGSKNINIVIPPADLKGQDKKLGTSYMTSFEMSSFVHLHVTVESQNHQEAAAYTITYSSGDPILFLQDGLITQYNLIPKKQVKFIYSNPVQTPIYLHASTPDSASLNKLDVKMYAMDDLNDEDSLISITPELPEFNKKTPNPTMLMLLPAKRKYMIMVTSKNDNDVIVTLGINNREVIYLPFDHEFPIQLNRNQTVYLVLTVSNPGYLRVTLSKCDESAPELGYTYDYNEFVAEDFDTVHQISDELNYDLFLKIKEKEQGVYIKLANPSEDGLSLMTVKATFSPNKFNTTKPKPGDNGVIKYQLLDSTKAELTFTSLVCAPTNKNCNKQYIYSALASDQYQNALSQLVCSSVAFDLPGVQQLKATKTHAVSSSGGKDNKIVFTEQLKGDVSYVGVKAVSTKTGQVVYYRPVQIVTLWGQINRSKLSTIVIGSLIVLICVCGILLIFNRYRKREYHPLQGDLDGRIDRD